MRQVFVKRDASGAVCGLSAAVEAGTEAVDFDDPAVQAFLRSLDLDLIRVLEDTIELLIARGVFRFTDLPDSARQKLLYRRELRSEIRAVPNPLGDGELL